MYAYIEARNSAGRSKNLFQKSWAQLRHQKPAFVLLLDFLISRSSSRLMKGGGGGGGGRTRFVGFQ